MVTKEENEMLTRIGPGTPVGELLRRYWHPVAVGQELSEQNPTRFVRILGEDLVLFRDKTGRIGLIEDRCAHRGASLCYGRVEERGIACPYHGWLYDTNGQCLETPPEPPESKFRLTVKQKAYPVQKFVGLYWSYLGPAPLPVIPKYDVWARRDGTRKIFVQPQLDCNWLQAMENSVDPSHLQILHQETANDGSRRQVPSTTRGFTDDIEGFDFCEVSYGIMKRRKYKNGTLDEHPLIFPSILRQGNATQIRVPIDDTHTRVFFVRFYPTPDGKAVEENENLPVEYVKPYKNPPDAIHPFTKFRMDAVQAQDHMAWETQGPIADRTRERLTSSDRGIVMLRDIIKREMDKVRQGLDPMGVIRDPAHAIIDTNLMESIKQAARSRAADAA
jgi:5,5'-dehydrodivanillate O-demethylase